MTQGGYPYQVDLTHVALLVQVHEVPPGFMLKGVAELIGRKLGGLITFDTNYYNSPWRAYMWFRVNTDINKPLRKQLALGQGEEVGKKVLLKYERLPTFCFIYGLIGHGEKFCCKVI